MIRKATFSLLFLTLLPACVDIVPTAPGGDDGTDGPGDDGPKPAAVEAVSGADQSAESGTALESRLVVVVLDENSDPLPGVPVHWSASAGQLESASTTTSDAGEASVAWTLGSSPGEQTATASVSGAGSVTFTATAFAPPPSFVVVESWDVGEFSPELLNDNGQILGKRTVNGARVYSIWSNGAFRDLAFPQPYGGEDLDGGARMVALNDAGMAAGWSLYTGTSSTADGIGIIRWDADGVATLVATGAFGPYKTEPHGMNEAGDIVGADQRKSIVWRADGGMDRFGEPGSYDGPDYYRYGTAISDDFGVVLNRDHYWMNGLRTFPDGVMPTGYGWGYQRQDINASNEINVLTFNSEGRNRGGVFDLDTGELRVMDGIIRIHSLNDGGEMLGFHYDNGHVNYFDGDRWHDINDLVSSADPILQITQLNNHGMMLSTSERSHMLLQRVDL